MVWPIISWPSRMRDHVRGEGVGSQLETSIWHLALGVQHSALMGSPGDGLFLAFGAGDASRRFRSETNSAEVAQQGGVAAGIATGHEQSLAIEGPVEIEDYAGVELSQM